jgi:hypothetical protein
MFHVEHDWEFMRSSVSKFVPRGTNGARIWRFLGSTSSYRASVPRETTETQNLPQMQIVSHETACVKDSTLLDFRHELQLGEFWHELLRLRIKKAE